MVGINMNLLCYYQVDVSKVISLCKLMESLLFQRGGPDFAQDPARLHSLIATTFVFCFVWTIGGNITESQWDSFDTFTKGLFEDNAEVKVSLHQSPMIFLLLPQMIYVSYKLYLVIAL